MESPKLTTGCHYLIQLIPCYCRDLTAAVLVCNYEQNLEIILTQAIVTLFEQSIRSRQSYEEIRSCKQSSQCRITPTSRRGPRYQTLDLILVGKRSIRAPGHCGPRFWSNNRGERGGGGRSESLH